MPAAIWETAQGGPGVLLAGEVGFGEDTVPPPFFRRTIRRRHGPCAYEVQFSSLGKEGVGEDRIPPFFRRTIR